MERRENKFYQEAIESVLQENKYAENYSYAEYIIKTYINDDRSYQRSRFLRVARISSGVFKYCEDTVRFLNPVLYQEYLDAVSKAEERRNFNNENNIIKIADAIRNGHFSDGTRFDILDFYRFVPLREKGLNFVAELKSFMIKSNRISDEDYETIVNYIDENKIRNIIFLSKNAAIKKNELQDNMRFTEDEIDKIFRYIRANGLPDLEGVYEIVAARYLNGEINFDNLEELENRSRNKRLKKYYKNPHKLELDANLNKKKNKSN